MLALTLLLLGISAVYAVEGNPFNDSITFWADDHSPMVVFPWYTDSSEEDWLYQTTGGARYPSLSGGRAGRLNASYAFNFVGTGLTLEGELGQNTGTVRLWNQQPANDGAEKKIEFPSHIAKVATLVDEEISAIPRTWYGIVNVPVGEDSTLFSFQAMTFKVPILTQAPPDLLAMQSQSHIVMPLRNKQVSKSINVTAVSRELDAALVEAGWSSRMNGHTASTDEMMVEDDVLWLSKNTELNYKVPKNTTLIQVLGPVGVHGTLGDNRQECLAHLEPPPFWWTNKRLPLSVSLKPQNRVQQTLFLLLVDPVVEHKLYLTSSDPNVTCRVSHIRSYPFHYDYNFGKAKEEEPPTVRLNSGVTAAVAVGSLFGGLLCGILGSILLIRRRRQPRALEESRAPFEVDPRPLPEIITPFMPSTPQYTDTSDTGETASSIRKVPLPTEPSPAPPTPPPKPPRLASPTSPKSSGLGSPSESFHAESAPPHMALDDAPVAGPSNYPRSLAPTAHEQDDEFATRQLLPPMYRSEWGDQQPVASSSTKGGAW